MESRWLTLAAGGAVVLASLACGTVVPGEEPVVVHPAEMQRIAGDFMAAERILEDEIAADPDSAVAWKITGDVKVSRGQNARRRWKRNHSAAVEAWHKAVFLDPADCAIWGRLAFAVASGIEDADTQVSGAIVDSLPWDQGWFECPGPAMVTLESLRQPSQQAIDRAREELGSDATRYQIAAHTNPGLVKAYRELDLSGLEWIPAQEPPAPAKDRWFVVLESSVEASGRGGSRSRTIEGPEKMRIESVEGGKIVFHDVRGAGRVRDNGIVMATACPGTTWGLSPDGYPIGSCVAGPYDPSKDQVHDPDVLKVAGQNHYSQPTIESSAITGGGIIDGTVECKAGPVGRLFVEIPTCEVQYYRGTRELRTIPVTAGRVAHTEEEAGRIQTARGMEAVYGPELAQHLAAGEIAVGMPYPLFAFTQTDLTSCTGRRLFQRASIYEDSVEFYCTVGRKNYRFRDFELVAIE